MKILRTKLFSTAGEKLGESRKMFSNKAQKALRAVIDYETAGGLPYSMRDLDTNVRSAIKLGRKRMRELGFHGGLTSVHDLINAKSQHGSLTEGRALLTALNNGIEKPKSISKRLGIPLQQARTIYDHGKKYLK